MLDEHTVWFSHIAAAAASNCERVVWNGSQNFYTYSTTTLVLCWEGPCFLREIDETYILKAYCLPQCRYTAPKQLAQRKFPESLWRLCYFFENLGAINSEDFYPHVPGDPPMLPEASVKRPMPVQSILQICRAWETPRFGPHGKDQRVSYKLRGPSGDRAFGGPCPVWSDKKLKLHSDLRVSARSWFQMLISLRTSLRMSLVNFNLKRQQKPCPLP